MHILVCVLVDKDVKSVRLGELALPALCLVCEGHVDDLLPREQQRVDLRVWPNKQTVQCPENSNDFKVGRGARAQQHRILKLYFLLPQNLQMLEIIYGYQFWPFI